MRTLKEHALAVAMSLGLTTFFIILHISPNPPSALIDLEHIVYDLRLEYAHTKTPKPSPRILIIDIDDKSLSEQGRWPWSRKTMAQLTEKLDRAGVAVISFDIQFSEHEKNPVTELLKHPTTQAKGIYFFRQLYNLEELVDADTQFEMQLRANKNSKSVIGFLFQHTENQRINKEPLPPTSIIFKGHPFIPVSVITPPAYLASLPQFQQAADGNGFITIKPDGDGILRRSALVIRNNNTYYPSLALETVRAYKDVKRIYINAVENNGLQSIISVDVGTTRINTNAIGEILIPYTHPIQAFDAYPATDILNDRIDASALTGSIAFVGTSALRLNDLRTTPIEPSYPGVQIQAMITQALLNPSTIPVEPDWMPGMILVLLLILGLVLSLALPFFGALSLRFLVLILPISFIALNVYFWSEHQLSIPLVVPLILILSILIIHISSKSFLERRQKQIIRSMFDQYVPASHINRLLRDPRQLSFAGERREMTVLFADIRNFTSISEKLSSNEIKRFLNLYFTPVTEVILKQQGTIDKYVGDMVMAFWNAPLEDKQHAKHAIQAALDMLSVTQQLKARLAKENLPAIEIGIGISTGFMNVGDMGSKHRRAYTVIGDTVNLGSRLESITKHYHIKLLVTEKTKLTCTTVDPKTGKVSSPWLFRYIDRICVKGREKPVDIYEVMGNKNQLSPSQKTELAQYHQAITYYQQRQWIQAYHAFTALTQAQPDTFIYGLYLERINKLQKDPPNKHWDGVCKYTQK